MVIANIDAERSLATCLRNLRTSCAGLDAELIVCESASSAGPRRGLFTDDGIRLLQCPADMLTPGLWAEGFRHSTGRIVAFTTAHCLVSPAWAKDLMAAIDQGAAGAGGPMVIGAGTGPLDWAVFFLRYSAFMPGTLGRGRIAGEIAGDNAAYRRDVLDRHAATFEHGFWEVDFHRLLRADGGWLAAVPTARAELAQSFHLRTIAVHRFRHGRQFGAGRVKDGERGVGQVVIAAPLIPFVLALRAGRRVFSRAGSRWRFAAALPWFLILAGAWAAGEACGALRGPGE